MHGPESEVGHLNGLCNINASHHDAVSLLALSSFKVLSLTKPRHNLDDSIPLNIKICSLPKIADLKLLRDLSLFMQVY